MAHDAFISYAFEDKTIADALCATLEAAGIACWIAPRDPRPGLPYGAQIVQAIAQSRIELLVLSRAANDSRAVLGEIEVGANRSKAILPVRIDAVEPADALEYYIRALHWFDATAAPLEARLTEVVGLVQEILGGISTCAPLPTPAKNNLPAQLTSFVGREAEVVEIMALLETHRLVTLTGSAGVGKTRVSLQVATNLLDGSGDGAWFVELAPLTSGEYVPSSIAQAMGLALTPDSDPLSHLIAALKGKRALLIFDNCEHLLQPAGRVASAILRECAYVKILASSRQALRIGGEVTYRLPSLAVPSPSGAQSLSREDANRYAAIALFVERALAVDRFFALTDENSPLVADICRRLDGIPLAIELAAARVSLLSPRQLRDLLNERFRVLTGGTRDALPRQQTLRAMIDWSYDLLDERERTIFRRLGIFVNGFTFDGAISVGGDDELDKVAVFDTLASLVEKSLVLAEPDGEKLRYRLLESTRAYALEKLEAVTEHNVCSERHLRYLRDHFVNLRQVRERTGRTADLVYALKTELEDVRSALDGSLVRPDFNRGGELLAASGGAWGSIGREAECIARCETHIEALSTREPRLLAQLSTTLSFLLGNTGLKLRALEVAAQAVTYARDSQDGPTLASALNRYAYAATFANRLSDADAAIAEAEEIPDHSALVRLLLLQTRASLSLFRGDLDTAASLREQQRKENRSLGDMSGDRLAAINLAEVEHARGRTQRAVAILYEILPAARANSDGFVADLLHNLSGYLVAIDDLPNAIDAARESIGMHAAHEPEHLHIAIASEHLALAFALRGEFMRAAKLEGYVAAAFQRTGFEREFTETATFDRLAALLREGLSPTELSRVTAEGAALSPDEAIAEALR